MGYLVSYKQYWGQFNKTLQAPTLAGPPRLYQGSGSPSCIILAQPSIYLALNILSKQNFLSILFQIKTWFQNRRTKWKKQMAARLRLAQRQGLLPPLPGMMAAACMPPPSHLVFPSPSQNGMVSFHNLHFHHASNSQQFNPMVSPASGISPPISYAG